MPMSSTAPVRPKYIRVEEVVLDRIRDGRYRPGDRLPTGPELSRELGFAYMTVQHAIGRLVRNGHLERKRGVGTFVCKSVDAPNIVMMVLSLTDVEPGPLARNELAILQRMASAEGREVRGIFLGTPLPSAQKIVEELHALRVGAVGIAGFLNTDLPFIRELSRHVPCVLFNKPLPGANLPYAAPDTSEIARLAVGHFIKRGRKRVGLISVTRDHSLFSELAFAVESELHRNGLTVDKGCWHVDHEFHDYADLAQWVGHVMAGDSRPDAWLVPNPPAAEVVRDHCRRLDIEIGRDVELIELYKAADAKEKACAWPLLAWNYTDVAEAASGMILDILNGGASPRVPVFRAKPELVLPKAEAEASTGAVQPADRSGRYSLERR